MASRLLPSPAIVHAALHTHALRGPGNAVIGLVDVGVLLALATQLFAALLALRIGIDRSAPRFPLLGAALVLSGAVALFSWHRGQTSSMFAWEMALAASGGLVVAAVLWDAFDDEKPVSSRERLRRRFEAMFVGAADALLLCTSEGVILDANHAAESVVRRSRRELRGTPLEDVIAILDDRPDRIALSLAARMSGELEGAREYRIRTEAGQTFWLEVDSSPIEAHGRQLVLVSARDITDRKNAEARIRREAERFDLLVDALPAFAWATDKNLVVTSARGKGLEALGMRAENVEGLSLADIYAKLELPIPGTPQHPRAFAGETVPLTWMVRGLTFEGALAGIRDSSGEIVEAVGIALDVTGRERARSEAGEREKALYAILDQAPASVAIKDASGRYLWVNRHWEKLTRRSRADTVLKTDADLFPRALARSFAADDQKVFATGEPMTFVDRVAAPDKVRSYLSTKFLLRDASGAPHTLCAISIDETERLHMQEELVHRDALLDEAQSMAGLASWEWDLQTGRHYWAPNFYELLGIDPETSDPAASYVTGVIEEDSAGLLGLVQAAIQDDVPYSADYRVRRGDGEIRWIHAQGRLERNAAGEKTRFFGFAQDVTDARQSEERLLDFNARLEARVSERAEQLERTIAELDSFSYAVSHDLRQPLRTISGYLAIMKEEHETFGDGARYLDLVGAAVRRMDGIITDLLALSRVSHGRLARRELDLTATARSVAASIADGNPGRDVMWNIQDGLRAWVDPDLAHLVVTNLLGNAFKFTSALAVAHIEVGCTIEDGEQVYFVRDDGAGFDPAFAAHLFEPFRRLHGPGEFEGNGMGLATVARIVRRHGGWIRAEGRPNKGATVRFTLPGNGLYAAEAQA